MNAKLKSLYWSLRKPNSVASALKQIVSPIEVEKLEALPAGEMLEIVAREHSFDIGSLLMAVGNLLNIAVLDGKYLPDRQMIKEFGFTEDFLEARNVLVCRYQQSKILLVTDITSELKDLAKNNKLELCLGLASNIKKNWQDCRRFSLNLGETGNLKTVGTKELEFILKNLVLDASKLGASELEIQAQSGIYSFTASGEKFEGNVHPLISTELLKWLAGKTKLKVRLISDWQNPVIFSRPAEEVIQVSWHFKSSPPTQNAQVLERIFRVLLLEDDRLFSTVLKSTLEKNGYQVFCFYTAEQALDALAAGELVPELVISDLHLPGINGDQFMESFRQLHADVPFLILTSDLEELREVDLVLKGVGAYLRKSEDIRIILAWCSQLLKKSDSSVRLTA